MGARRQASPKFFRFGRDRSGRRDGGEHESVDKLTEEIRIVDEITRRRDGRRGAFGDFPKLEMNQNSLDDCRILQEADDGHRPLALWADKRIGFVNLLDEPGPITSVLFPKYAVVFLGLFSEEGCATGLTLLAT